MIDFNNSLEAIPGIGLRELKKLNTAGISTIEDLLYYFPFRYEDFSLSKDIIDIKPEETVTIKGKVISIKSVPLRNRKKITEVYIEDNTAPIKAVWFNFALPLKFLKEGKYVQMSGKVSLFKGKELYFQHPNFEVIAKHIYETSNQTNNQTRTGSTNRLLPIYPENKTVNSYFLRKIIQDVLRIVDVPEFIPKDFLKKANLPEIKQALISIHFPENKKLADIAKKRFAFEKMFLVQLKALEIKQKWDKNKAVKIEFDKKLIKNFVENLPFGLTGAQKKASWQIIKDLEKAKPMNRLLEGDVGTGKTIVSVMAILSTLSRGFQVALLAPTEVLAIQHYFVISKILSKYKFNIGILTSSKSEINGEKISKKNFAEKLKNGEISLIIGTHAIIQKKIEFDNLVLVIIDEQHRFGVRQRAFLQQNTLKIKDKTEKIIPHLLTMTATPIPRTLSLAIFGNLDLSIIDEYPKNKKKVITSIILPRDRQNVYNFVTNEVKTGQQIFVICPLVEESSKISEVKSAKEEFERLKKQVFPNFSLGLLHGKMKPKEKESVMRDFKEKKFDILVSTAVVEVGIDIPNATVMIIEGAERFGLSQLHQFRGRVGRGEKQSYCFLFTSNSGPASRLKIMEKTTDGFKISESDLRQRGPGQFLGTAQSGIPDVAMESLSNMKLIQLSRICAQSLLKYDPLLKNFPLLKEKTLSLEEKVHFE